MHLKLRSLAGYSSQRRAGLAPLDFVMALPILMLMLALILKLGQGSIYRMQVTITARRDAAVPKAALQAEQAPLPNLSQITVALRPDTAHAGLVVQPAQTALPLRPVFPSTQEIRARHVKLLGSWDHTSVEFQDRPFYRFFDERAFFMAGVGTLQPIFDLSKLAPLDKSNSKDAMGSQAFQMLAGVIEKSNQGFQYFDQLKNFAKDPKKAIMQATDPDLIRLLGNKKQLTDSIDALKKVKDTFGNVKRMIQNLQNAGSPGPNDV